MDGDQEPPTSLVYVKASELFPKKSLCTDDETLEIPYPELNGESVEFLGSTAKATIAVSNYRLFIHLKDSFVNVPLRLIESFEIRDLSFLHINCKDARSIRIVFDSSEQCFTWYKRLGDCASHISCLEDLFCFAFYAWSINSLPSGPCDDNYCTNLQSDNNMQYSFMSEVRRMGFDTQPAWRITDINSDFSVCRTYPKLHIVPQGITNKEIEKVASFRSSGRFPSVVWRHMTNGAVIARSSQPEVGWFGWRSDEDELLLKLLGTACACDTKDSTPQRLDAEHLLNGVQNSEVKLDSIPNGHCAADVQSFVPDGSTATEDECCRVLILDARSYTAAVANRAKGGGCEYSEYYPSCEVQFMNLANIHGIRKSFQSLRTLCSGPQDQPKWYSMLENTCWLHHISMLIKAAVTVVNAVHHDKRPVLVHCSDGWDRTPQIVALAELLLDPYYRTIEGFQVLIEREWLEFGHRFADRCGHGFDRDENQRCPVFLQWLDCVHQLIRQFPCSFEFNETLLVKLVQHTYSCLFGTFLCNSERERLAGGVKSKTCSLWSLVRPKRKEFTNFLYSPNGEQVIEPSSSPRSLVLWSAVFLAYPTRFCDLAEIVENNLTQKVITSGYSSVYPKLSRVHSCCSDRNVETNQLCNSPSLPSSKSDGDLVKSAREHKDCIRDYIQRSQSNPVDSELRTKFCGECKDLLAKNISSANTAKCLNSKNVEDPNTANAGEQYNDSKDESGSTSIISCDSSTPDINDSMTSSTATVILSCSECLEGSSNGTSGTENRTVEGISIKSNGFSQSSTVELDIPATENTDDRPPRDSEIIQNSVDACDGNSAEQGSSKPAIDSSDKLKESNPSNVTLRASGSTLFSKYLDIDGLTLLVDIVQERLMQIQTGHQQYVDSLHAQLAELVERRRAYCGLLGPGSPHRASDLADEICSLPDSNGSADHPSLSGCSTDENSWIHIEEKDSQPTLWVPDHLATNCAKCDAKFWVANRKHHCRNCGRVFCSTCSDNALPVPNEQLYDPVRVCITCFEKLVSLQQLENGGRRPLDNMSIVGS